VWVSDDTGGEDAWILAEVVKKDEKELHLQQADKTSVKFVREVDTSASGLKYKGVELANAPLSAQDKAEGRDDDLITLPHLHEPALLHACSERFFSGKIYTWTGPVLIAVNPFQRLPLYTTQILEKYRREGLLRSQGMGDAKSQLGPHVYAIADRSYRQMMAEARKSQSILISGESGAGKTESTKIVMLYLTTLGASSSSSGPPKDADKPPIMERVLQSNPVLEAFGNARTLRNDNSSRFGKFIELGFSRAGHLLGAKVQTYLLEKVRIAFHASGERNYHIFYQLLRGATDEQKKHFEFHDGLTQGLELPNYFHYTGQGGAPHLREFTDEAGLKYTLKAMKNLGWSQELIDNVLSIIAGILHLGQVKFDSVETEGGVMAAQAEDDTIVKHAARLLGVDIEKLTTALTERVIVARGQEIRTNLTAERAVDARDALSKTLYGAMFLWVVDQVNKSCSWDNDKDVRSSCGVLDIFGFECFAINSFEQLCINFTNEALQQQFNKFIFKMEQEEYERENIEWAFIEFPDNQDCLDTIQMRKVGILAMLDDECRLPRGSDKNWAKRMYENFLPEKKQEVSKNTRFKATFVQKSKSYFCVRHFAGIVEYRAETGFMEKNKDEIPLTAQTLFSTAPNQLVQDVYAVQKRETEDKTGGGPKPGKPAKSKTVGQQFKAQLATLIESVETTDPHYIRCLKPNDAAKPLMLTRKRLTEQLRYGGVLEAVRVARMGFPVRLVHDTFFKRYRQLLPAVPEEKLTWNVEEGEPQKLCIRLVELVLEEGKKQKASAGADGKLNPHEEGITRSEKIRRMYLQPNPIEFPKTDVQLGKTKVFLRKPPHDALEAHRVYHQRGAATIIQCWMRGLESRKNFLDLSYAVITAQRCYRGFKGRERWWTLRRAVAGDLLTNTFRMLIVKRRFDRARKGTIQIQAVARGHAKRRDLASIKIQQLRRMVVAHSMFRHLKSAVISLQCRQRCRVALAEYDELRREQKDIGKLKQNNEKLKTEMASLKAMLQAQAQSASSTAQSSKELEDKQAEIDSLEKKISKLEEQLESEKAAVKKLEEKMQKQSESFVTEKKRLQETFEHEMKLAVKKHGAQKIDPASPKMSVPKEMSPVVQKQMKEIAVNNAAPAPSMPILPDDYVSPKVVEAHKRSIARLEQELAMERGQRRKADGEIIKLRAEINGVELQEHEVQSLLAQEVETAAAAAAAAAPVKEAMPEIDESEEGEVDEGTIEAHSSLNGASTPSRAPEVTGAEEEDEKKSEPHTPAEMKTTEDQVIEKMKQETVTPEVVTALNKLGINAQGNHVFSDDKSVSSASDRRLGFEAQGSVNRRSFLLKSPSEYLPMIRRGFSRGEEKEADPVVSVGWKVEVRNRKEREEMLRDDVDRFEIKMKRFANILEEGIDVTMWQLSRSAELSGAERDDFGLKSTAVTVKLHRRGKMYVQAVLTFSLRGGYLSKAIGRHRADKAALEPLSLYDILEVKAGCSGYDHAELPTTSKNKSSKRVKSENKQSSLFLTIKATPTPEAAFRSYIFRFKSRAARNDVLNGLRSMLADMQIREGVSISSLHQEEESHESDEIMVPLTEVHNAINREREAYDRLLLMLLQGSEDLKEKEDELLTLRGKLDGVEEESAEKDRVQANDSKLIMQLSKKLETLLMDNEDLRDQNDRLNSRLVAVECEKMNLMGN